MAYAAEQDGNGRQPVGTACSADRTQSSTAEPRNLSQVTVHDTTWVSNDVQEDVQASVPFKAWIVASASGEYVCSGSAVDGISAMDYFLMIFPPAELGAMVRMTNERLLARSLLPNTTGELVKFFGILILSTRVQFGSRDSLWSNRKPGKNLLAHSFCATSIPRDKFNTLWGLLRLSNQPAQRPPAMPCE
eukprot:IDg8603t1